MKHIEINKIKVGNRFRKDLGDVNGLALSIKELGLLQPIGVTKDNDLVFGERRLTACKRLGWKEIPVRVIEIARIVDGEFAENEIRKDFTVSERVAIAEAVRDAMPERRGRDNVDNYPQYKAQKTRDIAAKKAGFGSGFSYRQARKIVEQAIPQVIAEVDAEELSVSAGAKLAGQPKEEQQKIIKLPPQQRKKLIRGIKPMNEQTIYNKGNVILAIKWLQDSEITAGRYAETCFGPKDRQEDLKLIQNAITYLSDIEKELLSYDKPRKEVINRN